MDLVSSELPRNRSGVPPESTYTEDRHIEEEYRTAGLSISEVALTVLRRAVYSRLIPNSNALFPPFRLNLVRLQSDLKVCAIGFHAPWSLLVSLWAYCFHLGLQNYMTIGY